VAELAEDDLFACWQVQEATFVVVFIQPDG